MKIRFSCPPELYDRLPRPQLARRSTPDWYRAMPMENPLPDGGEDLTVKHCLPFVDALTHGFMIPLQADIHVRDGEFTWDWDWPESPMGLHFPTQAPGVPFVDQNRLALKAINFWTIHTEPGYATLFTHPLNRLDLPFRALSGLVDTDGYDAVPVHFPMIWLDEDFEGTVPAGTPVVQCIPIRRERLELEYRAMTETEYAEARTLKDRIKAERGYYKTHLRQPRP
jgi:hypothetical protein